MTREEIEDIIDGLYDAKRDIERNDISARRSREDIDKAIKVIEALQAEPRAKGEWITDKDGYPVCSECGFSFGCIVCPHEETDFCPNCGAKMDKE